MIVYFSNSIAKLDLEGSTKAADRVYLINSEFIFIEDEIHGASNVEKFRDRQLLDKEVILFPI